MREAIQLARRQGQKHFPARPIYHCFTASVQNQIRKNPLGAISFAARCIAERESLFDYVEALPIPQDLKNEIKNILTLDYVHQNRKQKDN